MKCKWYAEFEGVCTNGECPYRGDTCPTSEYPEACKFGGIKYGVSELVKILRCSAGDDYNCAACTANLEKKQIGKPPTCWKSWRRRRTRRSRSGSASRTGRRRKNMKHTFVVLIAACFRAASILTTYAYFMATGNGRNDPVTHWMPLPEPPKEEKIHE